MGHNCLVIPEVLTRRIGGPLGTRAATGGLWRDPRVWTYMVAGVFWLVLIARQLPCRMIDGHFPNPYLRVCYSDIWTLFLNRHMIESGGIYTSIDLEYPVVIGYFIMAMRALTAPFASLGGAGSSTGQVAASQIFFQWNAIFLFAAFMVLCWAHLRLGRPSRDESHRFSWDAMFIAASPVVLLNGLINWDLLVLVFTSLGLLAWSRSRPGWAGIWLGVGFATKFYPLLVLVAITLLCIRAAKHRQAVVMWVAAVLTWGAVNAPMMIISWSGWVYFWSFNADRKADLGSLWYVISLMGFDVPGVSGIAFALMAFGGIGIAWLVIKAPRRPRVAQVGLLLVIVFLIFNKVYSPQFALWLLPLVVLARPKFTDVAVWSVGEVIYNFSVWGMLQGALGIGTDGEILYWLAIIFRVVIQVWVGLRVIDDMMRPWEDPVRIPHTDDPHGGVLDHALDADWVVILNERRRPARVSQLRGWRARR
ncbi:hypothetical protein HMPREF1531_00756 [Propionibacterium sp. oral taxon 192 str. F0372]|nr:hypothetical protein HMPREF1531_00756 [Propionibacterium sp. oral taxon 192 str. F0372]